MIDIHAIWFAVIGLMLTMYALLDGFDLGVGALHLIVGRTEAERGRAIGSIGPVWNGNEVWLIASGGALVVAFPHAYATAFSGFYLALMLVLWLLILRGVGIELRHQIESPLWRQAWDVTFSGASALLAVLFGVALANVMRGVPFEADGSFVGSFALLLNPFALLGGVLSLILLSLHGAAYLALKTDGEMHDRAWRWVGRLHGPALGGVVLIVAVSFFVRPDFTGNFLRWPVLIVFPLLALAAMVAIEVYRQRRDEQRTFAGTSALIVALLASVFSGLFPNLLPALAGTPNPGLTIYNAAAPERNMQIALAIYLLGMLIVSIYLVRIYRVWRGKVAADAAYHA
jgi:cytochrome bd ubiquinol oxidase subunit II